MTLPNPSILTPNRLLARRLPVRLLGQELGPDVYLRNGFRLVGASPGDGEAALERACQKVRNLLRLDPRRVADCAVVLDYEDHARLGPGDTEIGMAHLRSPRSAVIDRLFWPHVAVETFRNGDGRLHLTQPRVESALARLVASGPVGESALSARHALAIVRHNRALAAELAFAAAGRGTWDGALWRAALAAWGEVLADEGFWDRVGEIFAQIDEPTLGAEEVASLRQDLPAALLAFHALFATAHAAAGREGACRGHLGLLRQAPFAEAVRRQALDRAGREVVSAQLSPLRRRLEEQLLAATEPILRKTFAPLLDALLEEATALHARCIEGLGLDYESLSRGAFDAFVQGAFDAVDRKLDYRHQERERSLLYSFLALRRLARLPLSPLVAQKIEKGACDSAGYLYGTEADGSPAWQPTECWFRPGAVPDPDASLEENFYRITGRQLEVDAQRGTAGVRVSWQNRRRLVPRSIAARDCHVATQNASLPGALVLGALLLLALTVLQGSVSMGLGCFLAIPVLLIAGALGRGLIGLRNRRTAGGWVRALEARHRFPPCAQLLHAEGFQRGEKPTDEQMKMTPQETQEARRRILAANFFHRRF